MALAANANKVAGDLLTAAIVYADTPEKKQLVGELIDKQVTDMEALYKALDTSTQAAGVKDILGAVIAGTLQSVAMGGITLPGRSSNAGSGLGSSGGISRTPGTKGEITRFVAGVKVVDQRTGQIFEGTVDLKPTLDRIQSGGQVAHRNDGTTYQNRPDRTTGEISLPVQPIGYYTEYVHPTTGIAGVGPQRIVVGNGGEIY